jgi:hypothetical protein
VIYIAGTDGSKSVYWIDGEQHELPCTGNEVWRSVKAIAVDGGKVHVLGVDNTGAYWIDGKRHELPKTGKSILVKVSAYGACHRVTKRQK